MEKSWVWWYVPVIPGMAGSLKYRECGPGWPGKKVIPPPISKINQEKEIPRWQREGGSRKHAS
jgi:hypothetical protein